MMVMSDEKYRSAPRRILTSFSGGITPETWRRLSLVLMAQFLGMLMLAWVARSSEMSRSIPFQRAISSLGGGRHQGNVGAWVFLACFCIFHLDHEIMSIRIFVDFGYSSADEVNALIMLAVPKKLFKCFSSSPHVHIGIDDLTVVLWIMHPCDLCKFQTK